jgi:hypothetical protein
VAGEEIPDLYSVKVMIGPDLAMDEANSLMMPANDQVLTTDNVCWTKKLSQIDHVCSTIASDPRLADGYNGLGISQGGLLLRGLAQRCPSPPLRSGQPGSAGIFVQILLNPAKLVLALYSLFCVCVCLSLDFPQHAGFTLGVFRWTVS